MRRAPGSAEELARGLEGKQEDARLRRESVISRACKLLPAAGEPAPPGASCVREHSVAVTARSVLLAAGGWRPGMLLTVLSYPGRAPTAEDYLTLKVSSVEAGKPCPRGKAHSKEMGGTLDSALTPTATLPVRESGGDPVDVEAQVLLPGRWPTDVQVAFSLTSPTVRWRSRRHRGRLL